MPLSLLAEMFSRQQAAQRTQPGTRGLRPGVGSYGSRPFQPRNPDAGIAKEQQMMQSPVFAAFMEQFNPKTPVSDFLRTRGLGPQPPRSLPTGQARPLYGRFGGY